MQDEKDKKTKSSTPPITIPKFLESSAILTLVIGAIYYLGWTHENAYFTRFGLQHESLELPTAYYLKAGYLAIASLSLLIYNFYVNRQPSQSKPEAITTNILLFIMAVAWLSPYKVGSKVYFYIAVGQLGCFLLFVITASLKGVSVAHVILPKTTTNKILFAYLAFGVLTINAYILGDRKAGNIIEGLTDDAFAIDFKWKETPSVESGEGELMLILHNKDRYYVVKKEKPAPAKPRVFIIPDEQVKSATTYSAN